jgi:hypothetical protein
MKDEGQSQERAELMMCWREEQKQKEVMATKHVRTCGEKARKNYSRAKEVPLQLTT